MSSRGVAEARELVARSFPVTAYEPEGDWTEARERFAALTARRPCPRYHRALTEGERHAHDPGRRPPRHRDPAIERIELGR